MPPPLTPFSPCAPLFCFSGLRSGIGAARGTPLFLTSGGRLHAQGGEGTYNVHDGQHILFHISAPMVGYHHLVSYHQGLHVALSADRALQTWLASLCFIAQGPGRWWLQAAQPPWPPLPWFLIWMENFWSFQVLNPMACLCLLVHMPNRLSNTLFFCCWVSGCTMSGSRNAPLLRGLVLQRCGCPTAKQVG